MDYKIHFLPALLHYHSNYTSHEFLQHAHLPLFLLLSCLQSHFLFLPFPQRYFPLKPHLAWVIPLLWRHYFIQFNLLVSLNLVSLNFLDYFLILNHFLLFQFLGRVQANTYLFLPHQLKLLCLNLWNTIILKKFLHIIFPSDAL